MAVNWPTPASSTFRLEKLFWTCSLHMLHSFNRKKHPALNKSRWEESIDTLTLWTAITATLRYRAEKIGCPDLESLCCAPLTPVGPCRGHGIKIFFPLKIPPGMQLCMVKYICALKSLTFSWFNSNNDSVLCALARFLQSSVQLYIVHWLAMCILVVTLLIQHVWSNLQYHYL